LAGEPVTVDMTDAVELGPLDDSQPYVFAISKWDYGKGPSGDPKVDAAFDVVKPEGINQKVFDSINLTNPNTKTRAINILAAVGGFGSKEEIKKQKKFKYPPTEDMLGRQFGASVKTQIDPNNQYPDKSVLRRVFTVEDYEKAVAAPGV